MPGPVPCYSAWLVCLATLHGYTVWLLCMATLSDYTVWLLYNSAWLLCLATLQLCLATLPGYSATLPGYLASCFDPLRYWFVFSRNWTFLRNQYFSEFSKLLIINSGIRLRAKGTRQERVSAVSARNGRNGVLPGLFSVLGFALGLGWIRAIPRSLHPETVKQCY